jgi:hypothetical protein
VDLVEIRWGGVDWIGLGQDRDQWKALVNAVMNLQVRVAAQLMAPWVVFSSMEIVCCDAK